jgi:uncharacterized protein with HEPN domain
MRDDRLLLQDILDAIEVIQKYLPAKRDLFDFNPPVQSHILRYIQIIGEVVQRLSQPLKSRNPQIPWKQIAGMRNAIVHAYFQIDWNEVYNTATKDVPALKSQIEIILASLP